MQNKITRMTENGIPVIKKSLARKNSSIIHLFNDNFFRLAKLSFRYFKDVNSFWHRIYRQRHLLLLIIECPLLLFDAGIKLV